MLIKSLQENILTLLCFSDDHAVQLSGTVDATHFDGAYRVIAAHALSYIYEFKAPPKAHLPDLLDNELKPDNPQHRQFRGLLFDLRHTSHEINPDFVLSKLEKFLTTQRLKAGIIDAANKIQMETDDAVESAQAILAETLKHQSNVTAPGVFFGDPGVISMVGQHPDSLPTGVRELDKAHLGPCRKELHMFMASTNSGKSWWLVQLGRQALLKQLKVLHVTMEMSQERVVERYAQNIFAIPKWHLETTVTRIDRDDAGRLAGLFQQTVTHAFRLSDEDLQTKLKKKLAKWGSRLNNILVKEFPTGSLTVHQLRGYLDAIEQAHHFIPDLILIDYPNLMKINPSQRREELGEIYVQLRGLAMERNAAVSVVAQANREGEKAKGRVNKSHIGEDYSSVQTADTVITYNQNDIEARMGLARLCIDKSRNERAGFSFMITQNYEAGQFYLDSAPCNDSYMNIIMPDRDKKLAPPKKKGL